MATSREWWFWRLSPAPKKQLASLRLPWSYLQADRDDDALDDVPAPRSTSHLSVGTPRWFGALRQGMALIEKHLRALGEPDNGHLEEAPIGAMRALKITAHVGKPGARRLTKKQWWLTPPVEQFCDLMKHFDPETIKEELGWSAERHLRDGTYWINRDVFEASGEFLKGSLGGVHRSESTGRLASYISHDRKPSVIQAADLPRAESPIAEFISVALDSYLERGPDKRFNPGAVQLGPKIQRLVDEIEWNLTEDGPYYYDGDAPQDVADGMLDNYRDMVQGGRGPFDDAPNDPLFGLSYQEIAALMPAAVRAVELRRRPAR